MKTMLMLALTLAMSVGGLALDLQPGREHIPGAETLMGMAPSPAGYPLRIFVTRPQGASGKLPVLFVVGWLSCDSVEQPKGPTDGFIQLVWDLAGRSRFATFRMDKPGVGDSGGPKCEQADFDVELQSYRAAFAAINDISFLDATRVYIVGFSNGGGVAPLVAENSAVRGYLLFGGWYKTWLEHMLEHERRRMKLSGSSEPEINARMKKYATFYALYLNHRQTPGDVFQAHPELQEIWYDKPDSQYGRPASFYQQLQTLNLADAWLKVNAPILAVHGEYDWIMSADDYRLLADAVNQRRPGSVEHVEWPRADHGLYTHSDPQKAFRNDPQAKYDPKLSEFVLQWLAKH